MVGCGNAASVPAIATPIALSEEEVVLGLHELVSASRIIKRKIVFFIIN